MDRCQSIRALTRQTALLALIVASVSPSYGDTERSGALLHAVPSTDIIVFQKPVRRTTTPVTKHSPDQVSNTLAELLQQPRPGETNPIVTSVVADSSPTESHQDDRQCDLALSIEGLSYQRSRRAAQALGFSFSTDLPPGNSLSFDQTLIETPAPFTSGLSERGDNRPSSGAPAVSGAPALDGPEHADANDQAASWITVRQWLLRLRQ